MKEFAPLMLIIIATVLLFSISYFNILSEKNNTKKGILNLTQLFILLFIWKFGSMIYVEKLGVLENDNIVFVSVLIIAAITGLINYSTTIKGHLQSKKMN